MAGGLKYSQKFITLAAIRGQLENVFTWLPGQVVAYDGTKNLADVSVMVKMPQFDDDNQITTYEDLGTLPQVPVAFYRAGGFYLAGPVQKNDEGILLFSASGLGEWRQSGQKSQPADVGRHGIGWPWFIPCAFNDTRALPDASARAAGLVIGKEGSQEQVVIQSGLVQLGASGAQPFPTKADYQALMTALSTLAGSLSSAATIANVAAAGSALQTSLSGPAAPVYTTLAKAK